MKMNLRMPIPNSYKFLMIYFQPLMIQELISLLMEINRVQYHLKKPSYFSYDENVSIAI